jgi:hypothetical protein
MISYYIIWDLNLEMILFICNFMNIIISIIFHFKSNILLDCDLQLEI